MNFRGIIGIKFRHFEITIFVRVQDMFIILRKVSSSLKSRESFCKQYLTVSIGAAHFNRNFAFQKSIMLLLGFQNLDSDLGTLKKLYITI